MDERMAAGSGIGATPMNLLLFNLATDADDPILGFTTHWLNRLAAHYDQVDVITMRAGRVKVAENVCVYSVGKEKGYSEARRALEFYRILTRLLRQRRYETCFAHMMPLFAFMGAPLLKLRRIPITLWYTHRSPHPTVRLGMMVSRRVVTAAPDSFPFHSPKLRVVGHGIDTEFFSPDTVRELRADQSCYIVHVARLMPIKHQTTLIHALANVSEARAVFVGDVPPEQDSVYKGELEQLVRDLHVEARVSFAGSHTPEAVREWYRRAAVAVNLSPVGLFDKAALESMAVGTPTIVSNPAFDTLLGDDAQFLRIPAPDDYTALAVRLNTLLALPDTERAAIGERLRERVTMEHSLDALIPRLVSILNTGEP
jgi:glycosyltransferase involved in cell wall biosynthesis